MRVILVTMVEAFLMAWGRRALSASLVWWAITACSGTAFHGSPGAAGSGGSGGQNAGGTGGAPQGGETATGGKSGMPGTAGHAPSGGAPEPGGAAGDGGAGGAEPEPSPANIPTSGMIYWFKADAGVVESDGGVKQWSDHSGRAHHAEQLLAEQRPKVTRTDLLALPVLELDGADDRLELPPIDVDVSSGLSFFAVAGRRDQSACSGILELSNGPEEDDISFDSTGDSYQFEIFAATAVASEGLFPIGTMRLLETIYTVDGASGTADLRVNGAFISALEMPPPVNLNREKNFIGFSQYANCTPFPGALAEIIMYERPLPQAERVAVESYLKAKWKCCGG